MTRKGKILLLVGILILFIIIGIYIYFEFIYKMNPFGEFPQGDA